ncbi:hypothetical protein PFLUV_G00138670 [Perca fluviatilis]|uniref:Uncharacterized protein n=1 Tax=Perca fluviatilis TaxID=8168 RepID=A0A6A5ET02_PERFL|nr:hypothetical protein PFLUV_G00138670 [Perca fluviatilis]
MRHRNFRSYSVSLLPFTSAPVPYWHRVSVPNPSYITLVGVQLMILFLITIHLIIITFSMFCCIKCQRIMKYALKNLRKPKVTSSNVFLCLTNGPKPKDNKLTIIQRIENQQILTTKKLKCIFY